MFLASPFWSVASGGAGFTTNRLKRGRLNQPSQNPVAYRRLRHERLRYGESNHGTLFLEGSFKAHTPPHVTLSPYDPFRLSLPKILLGRKRTFRGVDNEPDRTKSEPPVRHKRRRIRGSPTQSNSTKQDTPSTRKMLAK
ncbi:hypothetical protein FRC14_003433 [Serendipita sp. 396]|nr:hypothetical protein FRC14_003433 [Serendipita sp. 396]